MSIAPARCAKNKRVRFSSMEDDTNEQDEKDSLYVKKRDMGETPKTALRAAKGGGGYEKLVEVVSGGRSGQEACGRWAVTLTLCASFLGLGMSISVLGPTFEDLAFNVKKNISNISYVFLGRSLGYLGGSLFGGILFECMNPHLLLGCSMAITAFGMFAIPFCKQVLLLTVFMSSIGLSMGVLDTGGNVLILNTWGKQAGPHMQALHFSFAAGAFVSPIIAKLLFGPDGNTSIRMAATNYSFPATIDPDAHRILLHVQSPLRSMWAYIVIASFLTTITFLFFIFFACSRSSPNKAQTTLGKPLLARHHTALVVLFAFFFFAYVGAEVMYGSYIYTYAKDFAQMEQAQAAGLNSFYWGAFAVCRGMAIFFATCMYPGTLILFSLVGSTISSLLLCLFNREKVVLWVCTCLYGASIATTFPSGISWIEQYTTVTGNTASVFVVGAALGEMLLPTLVGFMLGQFPDKPVMMYMLLVNSTITVIIFPVMYKLATTSGGESRKPHILEQMYVDDSEFCQALLNEDDPDQWNDADFEFIEMDTTALVNSPPAVDSSHGVIEPMFTAAASFSSTASVNGASPKCKMLLPAEREKRD